MFRVHMIMFTKLLSVSILKKTVNVDNEEDLSGRLIAAFYKNGRNTGMKFIELKQGSNTEQFDLSGIDADSYKVFVWDSEQGIIPLPVYKAGKI